MNGIFIMDEKKKKSILDVIQTAIKRETEAFNYYQKATLKATFPETESLFIQLAEEERKHRYFLIKELEKINKLVIEETEDHFIDEKEVRYVIPDDLVFKRIQKSQGVDVASLTLPTELLGGDYLDTFSLDQEGEDSALGVFLYDVMGHGLEATQLKAVTKKIYVQLCEAWIRGETCVDMRHTGAVIRKLNQELVDHCQQSGRFITAFYGVINPIKKLLTYTSAGHEPLIQITYDGKYIDLADTQLLLGVDKNIDYTESQVSINTCDILVLYSDGLTEASNPTGDMFERERLIQIIQEVVQNSVKDIVHHIIDALRSFLGGTPMVDEISLSVIKVEPVGKEKKQKSVGFFK